MPLYDWVTQQKEDDTIPLYDWVTGLALDLDLGDYRLGEESVDGTTIIEFSTAMINLDYYITINNYTSLDGVVVEYGWTLSDKDTISFTFTPPSRYPQGTLTYEVRYYK